MAPIRKKVAAIPNPSQKTGGIAAATLPNLGEESPAPWQNATHERQHRSEQQADPRGDDLRRLDDLHRPDDRRDRDPDDPGRPLALGDGSAVDRQRLPALALGALRLRRPPRRHRRPPAHGHDRRRRLRHGFLVEWTWRAIFWVNIPVAIIALSLIAKSKPADEKHPAPLGYRGALLITAGMGLAVLGLQQSSMYAQISLGESASETGLYLLIFFAGFATASQWGGKILDRVGARPAMVVGCAVAAVGFYLWGRSLTELWVSDQWYYIVIAGAGVGLVLSPANTDALNRVPRSRYGEATGITKTVRNFGSSLGLAVLGTILISENRSNLEATAAEHGAPKQAADGIADAISQGSGNGSEFPARLHSPVAKVAENIPHDFALATRTVFYGMAAAMVVAFLVALLRMP